MKKILLLAAFIVMVANVSVAQQNVLIESADSTRNVADSVKLNEITIISNNRILTKTGGTIVAKVNNTELSSAGTGRDVLKHIPGIKVTDDAYEVTGKGNTEIYIDSHKVNSVSEIDRLESKNINRVEVIRQPGSEYGANVMGVIRIITNNMTTKKMSVDGMSRNSYGRNFSNCEKLSIDYKPGKLSLGGMLYYSLDHDKRIMEPLYDINTTDILKVKANTDIIDKGNTAYFQATAGYEFDKNNSIGVLYEYGYSPDFSMKENSSYCAIRNGISTGLTEENYITKIKNADHLINVYYIGHINNWKVNFNSDIVASYEKTDQNGLDGKDIIIETNAKNFSNLYAEKLNFSHNILGGEIKFGGDVSFISRRSRFRNPQNILPESDNKIHESREGAFTEYSITAGSIGVNAGLRYEHTDNKYWDSGILIQQQSRTYNDWLPTLSVDFPIGVIHSSVSYTVKKNRPSFNRLQSNLNYNNSYIYEGGNPLLIAETDKNAEWDLSYKWIVLQLSYKYAKNFIDFDGRSYDKNPDVAIFSITNYNHAQFANASLYLSPVIKCWSPVFGIDFTKPFFTAMNKGESKKMDNPTFNFTFNNSLTVFKNCIVNLDMNYNTGGDYGPCHSDPFQTISFGIRKSFLKKSLDVQLQMNDIFVCHNDYSLYSNKLVYSKSTIPDSRQALLTIRYTFNPQKSDRHVNHVSDEDINRIK
ncbi:TonB-dependent receptor domain-containing protein [Xylanibacter oryzae]|uniref:TonB-dependent receptor domain-containing protein n=1 Tax=Xylanibacter oryzae TaxID=185293 RepID=UPI0004BC2884|nr:TonB-dependent receptor [Xylanibacter oryzae]